MDRARPGKIVLTTFKDLGLAEPVLNAVLAEGYETPTPIQEKAIPVMMTGRDVVGIAQTGTGKTAAFVLPQLDRLARDRRRPQAKSATVLVLAPTRELVSQIAESIRVYGRSLNPSIAIVIGGAKPGPQVRAMARGVDFLVATPGRLLDHMETGAINLKDVTTVILDEADQMLDLGFMPAIRRIMGRVPAKRQTLLFSATMPQQIRKLADDFLNDPVQIAVAAASKPIERIEQTVIFVEKTAKPRLLASLLKDGSIERAVVFTRTKHGADRLCQQLDRAGIEAQPIHGNKSQGQRERTLSAFRDGSLSILVATDIAARGIDIDDISHVFNYELPHVPEIYVHRIGRTARAGKSGHAVAFCDSSERSLLRDIERLTGIRIPIVEATVSEAIPQMSEPRPAARSQEPVRHEGGDRARNDGGRTHGDGGRPRHFGKGKGRPDGSGDKPAHQARPASQKPRRPRRRKPAGPVSQEQSGQRRMQANAGGRN
jgi:ATP-dependent RNA helicase RhlE